MRFHCACVVMTPGPSHAVIGHASHVRRSVQSPKIAWPHAVSVNVAAGVGSLQYDELYQSGAGHRMPAHAADSACSPMTAVL